MIAYGDNDKQLFDGQTQTHTRRPRRAYLAHGNTYLVANLNGHRQEQDKHGVPSMPVLMPVQHHMVDLASFGITISGSQLRGAVVILSYASESSVRPK